MPSPEQQLFDPDNVEAYAPPQADEPPAEESPPAELSYYTSLGVSPEDEAEIDRQLELGQLSREQIERRVLGPEAARGIHAKANHLPRTERSLKLQGTTKPTRKGLGPMGRLNADEPPPHIPDARRTY